jgi:outer membrane protein OmpA-like peptidoglycan-associated protein
MLRYSSGVRLWVVTALLLVLVRAAHAQPVSFELAGDVPIGQKPQLKVTAVEPVSDMRLELQRDDGKRFSQRQPGVAKGRTVALPVGDGAAGKSSYKGKLTVVVAGKPWIEELTFDTLVRAPLKISYDAEHLDLDKHVLQFRTSRPPASAELTVIGDDGSQLGTGAATFTEAPADGWWTIAWTQPADTRVMTMKLRVVAPEGAASTVELVPWSVSIDHEDVNFSTDSSKIEASETGKLDTSLEKIADVVKRSAPYMKMRLYIAGHTDTVGPNAKNRKLSMARAQSIAQYFRKHGLALPIALAGFGEEVLKVKTADNTDERANRRVDYVIGPAAGAPPFKGAYLKVRADWKQLR